ncbi:MAG: transcriptional repressor [Vulcanimicrobiaceae bacterium]
MAKGTVERNTRQKTAIRSAFESEGRPLSTTEAFEAAQSQIAGLGIATVYRSIKALLDDGWLTPIDVPGRGVLYELAGKEHHHHFSCTSCRRVFELVGCASDVHVTLPRGFKSTGHDVTIFGRCAACATPPLQVVTEKRVIKSSATTTPAKRRR